MSAPDFSYSASHGYSFDWMATPGQCGTPAAVLNDPKHNTPRPCLHGEGCTWKNFKTDRGCGFVHPGEEGIARRLFPGRTTRLEDGRQIWEPAVVRLVGGATYYERRRLGLSWSEWKEQQADKAEQKEHTPLRAEAPAWHPPSFQPPLPPGPPPTQAYHKPQQMMLSAWFPSLPPSPPPAPVASAISFQQRLQEQLIVKAMLENPAISEPARAMCRDIIADVLSEANMAQPVKGVSGQATSYSWDPSSSSVKKETYTAELH